MPPEEELSPEEKLLRVIQKGKTPRAPDSSGSRADGDDDALAATQKLVSLPIRSQPPKKAVRVAGRPVARTAEPATMKSGALRSAPKKTAVPAAGAPPAATVPGPKKTAPQVVKSVAKKTPAATPAPRPAAPATVKAKPVAPAPAEPAPAKAGITEAVKKIVAKKPTPAAAAAPARPAPAPVVAERKAAPVAAKKPLTDKKPAVTEPVKAAAPKPAAPRPATRPPAAKPVAPVPAAAKAKAPAPAKKAPATKAAPAKPPAPAVLGAAVEPDPGALLGGVPAQLGAPARDLTPALPPAVKGRRSKRSAIGTVNAVLTAASILLAVGIAWQLIMAGPPVSSDTLPDIGRQKYEGSQPPTREEVDAATEDRDLFVAGTVTPPRTDTNKVDRVDLGPVEKYIENFLQLQGVSISPTGRRPPVAVITDNNPKVNKTVWKEEGESFIVPVDYGRVTRDTRITVKGISEDGVVLTFGEGNQKKEITLK